MQQSLGAVRIPFVEFLEEADLGELDVVIGQANLATDALRKVHFRASVGKHCVLGLKNQDSQSLRTVKFTVALPAEIFVGLFLYSSVCSYVSQPWVTGPNKVSWCSLPVPPSTCKPGVGLHGASLVWACTNIAQTLVNTCYIDSFTQRS